jgi:transposase
MRPLSIDCDAHKHYSQLEVQDANGQVLNRARLDHRPGVIASFFSRFPSGTPVAFESVGNWYWIADEIKAAGCLPLLTNPAKAKLMMGHVNKADNLDANGLATLLRIGTLPTVWLPPAALRDQRELPRTRMALCAMRTSLKNRIHSTLAKEALSPEDGAELFSKRGRAGLESSLSRLPQETARFPYAPQFSSYCGTIPRISSSGGKTRYGKMRSESNHSLMWAFIEAVIGAVARHLAESTVWILSKNEPYREPSWFSPRQG